MRDNRSGGALTETTFLILLSTYTPKHGYAIMQFIELETNGRVLLGAGTLYGAINSLLDKKWIISTGASEPGSNKKDYEITPLGRMIVEREIARIHELYSMAKKITDDL
ncbi:MAG: PadR family transcriptional regulator [Lachnospiraceae bacterium]|jgi:DNA-binding PadR family transcriptional regulator|nr:PadR family transcriptional regulator [Lachnospiraceae bacterium]